MSEPLLSIRNLTKVFGGLVAVDNVSLDVRRGEVVGLLGDNGAGKSTLIKCVSGVYHAEEGEITFDGKPAVFTTPMDARRVGIETIYQDLALANNLDVGANIFLGREVKKRRLGGLVQTLDDRQMLAKSHETLELLQIRFPTLTAPIQNLSGGQRQAVAIARAVYWEAKLMIMDEPTNNLGVPEQHKVLELIRTSQGPWRAGHPHHAHSPRRLRRHRPGDRHAPRPQGRREGDGPDERGGTRPVHGRRARRRGRLTHSRQSRAIG